VGARIDSAGKKTIIKKLNEIVGENKYTVENTKKTKTNNGITEYGLACIFEIIVREYNSIHKDGRIWYMSPEPAIFNNIEKK
jgi:thymidylate kinase